MKKLIIIFFILGSCVSFAATQTDMSSKWICTTNASSSDAAADKAADDKMANTTGPADQSFAFAAQNCRDCTKITCEAKD
ncbi:Uncharacterised protein [Legionella sainthelensi]|uniref:hypothetical protein n=1 Tax=Legionella sainthelensi TaxID=28087 RepID=UPI000E207D16|nr:hypothetical protein [Legionella sainthelensi]VEB35326.1 Uncharacterised protein [Legionella sainthelensi]